MLMMEPMHHDPSRRRFLHIAHAQQRQHMLQPQWAFISAMREQPVETGTDPHRAEDVIPNWQPQYTPPTEYIRQKRQRNCQMEQDHTDQVRPDDSALVVDQLRPRQ